MDLDLRETESIVERRRVARETRRRCRWRRILIDGARDRFDRPTARPAGCSCHPFFLKRFEKRVPILQRCGLGKERDFRRRANASVWRQTEKTKISCCGAKSGRGERQEQEEGSRRGTNRPSNEVARLGEVERSRGWSCRYVGSRGVGSRGRGAGLAEQTTEKRSSGCPTHGRNEDFEGERRGDEDCLVGRRD